MVPSDTAETRISLNASHTSYKQEYLGYRFDYIWYLASTCHLFIHCPCHCQPFAMPARSKSTGQLSPQSCAERLGLALHGITPLNITNLGFCFSVPQVSSEIDALSLDGATLLCQPSSAILVLKHFGRWARVAQRWWRPKNHPAVQSSLLLRVWGSRICI